VLSPAAPVSPAPPQGRSTAAPLAIGRRDLLANVVKYGPVTLAGHAGEILCAVFSPDGRCIATASDDGTARIWDLRRDPIAFVALDHADVVQSVAFSRDGTRLVSASQDGTAKVWDVGLCLSQMRGSRQSTASVAPLSELTGHADGVRCAALSVDGRRAVTVSEDGAALLWRLDVTRSRPVPLPHPREVNGVAYGPHGQLATVGDDDCLRLWETEAEFPRQLLLLPGPRMSSVVAWSADGQHLIGANQGGPVHVVDLRQFPPTVRTIDKSAVGSVALSPDGRCAAVASLFDGRVWLYRMDRTKPESVALIDHRTGFVSVRGPEGLRVPMAVDPEHTVGLYHVMFSADGRYLISASSDNNAKLWKLPPVCVG
jgi:WD40 repeat protein